MENINWEERKWQTYLALMSNPNNLRGQALYDRMKNILARAERIVSFYKEKLNG